MVIRSDKVILLAQLTNSIEESGNELEKAYVKNDKRKFDLAKSAILEVQSKINFLLNQE
jgi:hypothetical protein